MGAMGAKPAKRLELQFRIAALAPAKQRNPGIRQRSRIGFADLEDRHQAAGELRLALCSAQGSERGVEFHEDPRLGKGGRQNSRFGGIEYAPLQFERRHGFDQRQTIPPGTAADDRATAAHNERTVRADSGLSLSRSDVIPIILIAKVLTLSYFRSNSAALPA